MPRVYQKKRTKTYVEGDIERAFEDWKEGLSIRKAASLYKIPPMTLTDAIRRSKQGNKGVKYCPPNLEKKVFTSSVEGNLAEYLKTTSAMYHGLTPGQVRQLAYEYAVANKINHPESWNINRAAGKDWFTGFMERNSSLSIRKPESTSLARITAFNRYTVGSFFEKLETIMKREKFESHRVFNLDETGISSTPKMPKLITTKGCHQFGQVVSRERGELVTMVGIVSASGNALPPGFVFPRVRFDERKMMAGATAESLGMVHKSGWMTSNNFLNVMKHFVKYSCSSLDNKSLLIMDNHESHISYDAVQYAKDNGVVILTIPPHTSNKLQPLDVSIYGPFKNYFGRQVQSWMIANPGKTLTIYDLPKLACDSWTSACTPANVKNGFLKTGILPFNPDTFQDADFLGSSVSDRPLPSNGNDCSVDDSNIVEMQSATTSTNDEAMQGPSNPMEVSFEDIRPYPKAPPRKVSNRGRKPGRTMIATDTPEKNLLLEKQMKKGVTRKETIPAKRIGSTKRSLFVEDESSTEESDVDERILVNDSSEFSEDCMEESDIFVTKEPTKDDFVLVKFLTKSSVVHYVGKLLSSKDEHNEYQISYLRMIRGNQGMKFQFPQISDEATVDGCSILGVLPTISNNSTKRSQDNISFSVQFDGFNMR